MVKRPCDVCCEPGARELILADRAALPSLAPWLRVVCERCLDRVRRNAGKGGGVSEPLQVPTPEERLLEQPGLVRREAGFLEHLHDLIGQFSLLGRELRRISPAQTGPNILVEPRSRGCQLVGEPVQVAHLLEQRLELHVIDRHEQGQGSRLYEPFADPPLPLAPENPAQLPELVRAGWKPATEKVYRNALDGYLVAWFGSTRLDAIRPRDVSAFVTDALTRAQGKHKRPLTGKYVNLLLNVAFSIFKSAIGEELVDANPVASVQRPKVVRQRWRILEPHEVPRVAKAFTDERARRVFLTLTLTGLRRSELVALRWRHVDLLEGTLRVEESKSEEGSVSWALPASLSRRSGTTTLSRRRSRPRASRGGSARSTTFGTPR